jgi:hypothetical protein
MRRISTTMTAAALLGAALASSAANAQGAGRGDKLSPPGRNDWRSTLLVCAEDKRIAAVFTGPEQLTWPRPPASTA